MRIDAPRLIALFLAVFALTAFAQDTVKPTAALANLQRQACSIQAADRAEREEKVRSLAQAVLEKGVQRDNLSRAESYALAELFGFAGQRDEANKLYQSLAAGDDMIARNASRAQLTDLARREEWAALDQGILAHRVHFPSQPDDVAATFEAVYALQDYHAKAGRPGEAIRLIVDELDYVGTGSLSMSWQFLDFCRDTFVKAGKQKEYKEICRRALEGFKVSRERLAALPIPDEPAAKARREQQLGHWDLFIRVTGELLEPPLEKMVGQAAADFEFTHFFNTKPITLADLRGKVVLIDFWANWCAPCKAAFPKLRALQQEFGGSGFTVLGITGFQGRFVDNGINETKLSPERELDLTKSQVERLGVTWPVAFSRRGCFDPEYQVRGVPTLVLVDKQGIIRSIVAGLNEAGEQNLRELLVKLLAE